MRLLIKLQALKNSPYEMQYHYQLQGFIYRLLRGNSKYDVHNKQGNKFFSFSNIFPFDDLRKNDLRNLMISSPNNDFISYLHGKLKDESSLEIGKMKFKVDFCDQFDVIIPNDTFSLITGTPITMRIRREKYDTYEDMKHIKNYYKYVYWRISHPIDLFITQLEDNLKKYNEYFGLDIQRQPIFMKFKPPKKQISTRLGISDSEQAVVIGTTWEFMFEEASPLVQFALDSGLGELNSMGFGFMNLISTGRLK